MLAQPTFPEEIHLGIIDVSPERWVGENVIHRFVRDVRELTRRRPSHIHLPVTFWGSPKIPANGAGLSTECPEDVLLVGDERDIVIGNVAAAAPEPEFRKKGDPLIE